MISFKLRPIRLGFRIATVVLVAGLCGAFALIGLTYNDFLIGDIKTDASAQILTQINQVKFDGAQLKLHDRQLEPYLLNDVHNPFSLTQQVSSVPDRAPTPPVPPSGSATPPPAVRPPGSPPPIQIQ